MGRITVLAVIFAIAGAAHVEAAERRVPTGWLGVTADGPMHARDEGEWDLMAQAGVETVRAAFLWSRVQPDPPAASGAPFDFESTDALVIAAAQRGMALLPVVQAAPHWAAVQPGVLASPPAKIRAVRRIFAALARRYGPGGSLWHARPDLPPRPIRAWQVFNEPNLLNHWSVQPFHRRYVATLRAARRGAHSVDPRATIVLGGLTNRSWKALRAVYAAGGRGSFDVVALHPYTSSPANILRIVRYARRVMRRHGDGRVPIWLTEFSWPATGEMGGRAGPDRVFGELRNEDQARLLSRTLRRLVTASERLRIRRVVWYTWLSRETDPGAGVWGFAGLRRDRGGTRDDTPALEVFRRWARWLQGGAEAPG